MRSKSAVADRLSFIGYQSPTLVEQPPEGDGWIHEIKHDGYRTQLVIEAGNARAYTRNGFDWSKRYQPIVTAAAELPVKSAILDGEMIVMNEAGISDFHSLRTAMRWEPGRLAFVAFDLLHLDGTDFRLRPLIERRAALAGIIEPGSGAIQFSSHVLGSGAAFFREVDRLGLEGMVSKRADSIYGSGPSKTWLKTKCFEVSEYAITGVLRDPGWPPMALMATSDAERRYVGSAVIGLGQAMRERLWKRVQDQHGPPAKGIKRKRETMWLKPGLVGRVRHPEGRAVAAARHAARDQRGEMIAERQPSGDVVRREADRVVDELPNDALEILAADMVGDFYEKEGLDMAVAIAAELLRRAAGGVGKWPGPKG